jgi:hypothetical protein
MGLLVDGKWHDKWYPTEKTGGRFIREDAQFRNWSVQGIVGDANGEMLLAADSLPDGGTRGLMHNHNIRHQNDNLYLRGESL